MLILGIILGFWLPGQSDWGFFGHRMINRYAVFTVPAPLNRFYKEHLPWVEEHGVDPDKRRYAVPQEYKRHYIDLDFLEERVGRPLGHDLDSELALHMTWVGILESGDSIRFSRQDGRGPWLPSDGECPIEEPRIDAWFDSLSRAQPGEEVWVLAGDPVKRIPDTCQEVHVFRKLVFEDQLTIHGILPYWLPVMYHRLTKAFTTRDIPAILRLSSDIGHYIGDAHVPLHTTINYNGQLTGQQGIHGFWESRIPELFSTDWDLVTGPAVYIPDMSGEAWNMVRESHALVAEVLDQERRIRKGLSDDHVLCFEDRNAVQVLTYCPDFAGAYQSAMDGMVERRFREAIQAVGSVWYSAWIDAGQPDLWTSVQPVTDPMVGTEALPVRTGDLPFGRPHENE